MTHGRAFGPVPRAGLHADTVAVTVTGTVTTLKPPHLREPEEEEQRRRVQAA